MVDPYFRIEVISRSPDPQQVIYAAMHQEIFEFSLTNSEKKVLLEKVDFDFVQSFKWHLGGAGYAVRSTYNSLSKKTSLAYMHREILLSRGIEISKGQKVDHKDGNKLNNCFSNLRVVTQSQNMSNRHKTKSNTSGYKGVRLHKPTGKWQAYIKVDYKQIHLGLFECVKDAAIAYNHSAIKFHGEFACLNEV